MFIYFILFHLYLFIYMYLYNIYSTAEIKVSESVYQNAGCAQFQ